MARRFVVGALCVVVLLTLTGRGMAADAWWSPGEQYVLWPTNDFANPSGTARLVYTEAPLKTQGHPFFEPLGSHGRACVSCHQPSDAMSLSVDSIQQRWDATEGKDPLFAAIDGSNCPSLPQVPADG